MAVKFTQDYTTEEAKPQTFHKDQTVDFYAHYGEEDPADPSMSDEDAEKNRRARAAASEQHFVNRGVAVRVESEKQLARQRTAQQQQEQRQQEQRRQQEHSEPGKPEQPHQQPAPAQQQQEAKPGEPSAQPKPKGR